MKKAINTYLKYRRKIIAFSYVDKLIDWDQNTQAPKLSAKYRQKQVEVLAEMYFDLRREKEFLDAIDYLLLNQDKIKDDDLIKDIKKINKDLRIIRNMPIERYIQNEVILAKSTEVWEEARRLKNFDHFVPILEEIVDYQKEVIKTLETPELKGYDVLLDMYEEGSNTKFYDKFFNDLKKEILPFVMEITKGRKPKFNRKLRNREYNITDQKKISKYLLNVLNFDLNRGAIRDTIHPFTIGISNTDVRITSDYYTNNFTTSIFSVLHEAGHGIYDQNTADKYNGTFLYSSSSFGLHEAQARLFENMIGRSYNFWKTNYFKLLEIYPKQLKGIELEEFYKYINEVKRSKIRTEADELTYSLHIMVRYEIEKELFNGNLKVRNIPRRFRTLMAKYVGVRPLDDLEGALQDIHWAIGYFGYFPAYALGNAYAAQIYNTMQNDINIDKLIKENKINIINYWLKENINKYGGSLTAKEILKKATKEEFNSKYYIDYLKSKFENIDFKKYS